MDLAYLDYLATNGAGPIHRLPSLLKVILAFVTIGVLLFIRDIYYLAGFYLLLYVLIFTTGLPAGKILLISLYPLLFILIFSYASAGAGWMVLLAILIRVLSITTIMILLFITTPYPCIFGWLGKIMPGFLLTTLFMTYRAIFVLSAILEDVKSSFHLRGGIQRKRPLMSLRNIARAFGYLLLLGFGKSEGMYQAMRLRGFRNKIYHWERHDQWKKLSKSTVSGTPIRTRLR